MLVRSRAPVYRASLTHAAAPRPADADAAFNATELAARVEEFQLSSDALDALLSAAEAKLDAQRAEGGAEALDAYKRAMASAGGTGAAAMDTTA